jgi:hypothetical protein
MDEREKETVIVEPAEPRVERETTIIHTGDRGGGGGTLIAVALLLVVAVLLFLWFSGNLGGATEEVGLNVNIETPKVDMPDIDVNVPPATEPANKSGE